MTAPFGHGNRLLSSAPDPPTRSICRFLESENRPPDRNPLRIGPRTPPGVHPTRFFILGSFLKAPGPRNGPRRPKTTKNRNRRFFFTVEVEPWVCPSPSSRPLRGHSGSGPSSGPWVAVSPARGGSGAWRSRGSGAREGGAGGEEGEQKKKSTISVFRRFRPLGAVSGPRGPQKRTQDEKPRRMDPGRGPGTHFERISVRGGGAGGSFCSDIGPHASGSTCL